MYTVQITLAGLAGRRFPLEPPKGKRCRLEARSGLLASAMVELPAAPGMAVVVGPARGSAAAIATADADAVSFERADRGDNPCKHTMAAAARDSIQTDQQANTGQLPHIALQVAM